MINMIVYQVTRLAAVETDKELVVGPALSSSLAILTRLGLGHFDPPRPWPFEPTSALAILTCSSLADLTRLSLGHVDPPRPWPF